MMEKQCKSLISAGFYTNENKPIGLFVYEGRKIKNLIANNLFNGIFSININNEAKITNEIKYENLRVGLQSGPIIMKDGESIALNVKNDKKSRRIVVAISDLKEIIFFVFYNKESVFTGPYLKDLPYALKLSEEKIGIKISDAINLDGGTASSFYTEYLNLSELTPIGSYFCLD